MEGIVFAVSCIIWFFLGGLCYIPLLLRTGAWLQVAILHAAFTDSEPTDARAAFQMAKGFYMRGFRAIKYVFGPSAPSGGRAVPFHLADLVPHLFWTLLFWGGVVVALNHYFRWFTVDWNIFGPSR